MKRKNHRPKPRDWIGHLLDLLKAIIIAVVTAAITTYLKSGG